MARGWESKSVEEQQSQAPSTPSEIAKLAPEARRKQSEKRALELQRARVLEQLKRSSNPSYTDLLQRELQYLEEQIAKR